MARMGVGELRSVFGHFLRTFGFRAAKNYSDVGGYQIDHYNGYTIEQIISAGGGVTQPFGSTRHTARELIDMLHFAMSVHDHQENEKRGRGRNPSQENPGKFANVIEELIYNHTDQDVSLGHGMGWYGLVSGFLLPEARNLAIIEGQQDEFEEVKDEYDWPLNAIIEENSQGFIDVTTYKENRDVIREWHRLVASIHREMEE